MNAADIGKPIPRIEEGAEYMTRLGQLAKVVAILPLPEYIEPDADDGLVRIQFIGGNYAENRPGWRGDVRANVRFADFLADFRLPFKRPSRPRYLQWEYRLARERARVRKAQDRRYGVRS